MQALDWKLLHAANGLALPFLDTLMLTLSDGRVWWIVAGLAAALGLFWRPRAGLKLALAIGLAVGLADGGSTWVLKPRIGRIRPCYQTAALRTPSGCGSRVGFPSNHAANGMAVTAVLASAGPWWIAAGSGLLAVLVGFSRVYLGVHFPTDVLGGFAFGAAIGIAVGRLLYRRKEKRGGAAQKPFTAVGDIS